jgi:PAS domain S-box-containing protein
MTHNPPEPPPEGFPTTLQQSRGINNTSGELANLRLSEDRFREFFATWPEYCYMISPSGNILDVNPAACKALGYSEEELISKHVSTIYGPESLAKVGDLLEKWKRNEVLKDEEMVVVTKKGEKRTVLLNARAVKDENGNLLHSTSVHTDITDRKRLEENLRENQARLEAIIGSAMDAIVTIDEQQRIMVFNRAAERIFGCTASDTIGTSIERFIPERLRDAHAGHIRQFGGSEVTSRAMGSLGELFGLRADGSEFPFEASISCTTVTGKKLYTVVLRDVTERLLIDNARRESEVRFRLVANAAPVLIWMSGVDKLCDYFNDPWLQFTGHSIDQELGNGWTEGVHPEDLQRCLKTYSTAFDAREPFKMEYRLRRHDREYRWIYDIGVPRFNADGAFAGYIGACTDVTEHKLAEEALSSMSGRLIEAQEQERTWIARELHDDVSQRLALVAMDLDRQKQDLHASAAKLRREIGESAKQISDLVSDIHAMSHRLHSSKLDSLGLKAAAAGFCKELSKRHDVEIAFHAERIPRQIPQGIALCLFRVLQEALQNATKHSRAKHFRVSLVGSLNEIFLTVSDPGLGFDPEEAMKGTGLGLTSMRERLRLVSGELSLSTQRHRGTTIRVRVPVGPHGKSASAAS